MIIRKNIVVAFVAVFSTIGLISNATAADYCVSLGGSGGIDISLDASDNVTGTSSPDRYWVGVFTGGDVYVSLGYVGAETRPVHHVWDIATLTGTGRAFSAGGYETWNYDWTFTSGTCALSSSNSGPDLATGQ